MERPLCILQSPVIAHARRSDIDVIPVSVVAIPEDEGVIRVDAEAVPAVGGDVIRSVVGRAFVASAVGASRGAISLLRLPKEDHKIFRAVRRPEC